MYPRSIRWRVQLWQAFLLVCVLGGFGITAYQLQRTTVLGQVDENLAKRVAALNAEVRGPPPFGGRPGYPHPEPPLGAQTNWSEFGPPPRPPGFDPEGAGPPPPRFGPEHGGPGPMDHFLNSREVRLSARTLSLFEPAEAGGFYYAIFSRSGTRLKASTNAPANLAVPVRVAGDTTVGSRTLDDRREEVQFTEIGECVLAGRVITSDLVALRRFAWWLVAAGTSVLALGLGGGWFLATRALRPVEEISAAASRISAGNLSERIDVAETDSELGRLATVLNSTFSRLEAAFAQQKQFTADASHELRTPLAVLISEAQAALARERSAAEYRETVEACLDTAQQMRR